MEYMLLHIAKQCEWVNVRRILYPIAAGTGAEHHQGWKMAIALVNNICRNAGSFNCNQLVYIDNVVASLFTTFLVVEINCQAFL
jgi:hypothetical protein